MYAFNPLSMLLLLLFSRQVMSDSLRPHGLQHTRLPCPSPPPRGCPGSCPLNRWCHPTNSSSVILFSFCLQSFPASGSFPGSQLFTSGSQSIGASASVISMSIQGWFPLGLTGLISLLSTGLSRVFSSTTQFESLSSLVLSLLYGPALTSIQSGGGIPQKQVSHLGSTELCALASVLQPCGPSYSPWSLSSQNFVHALPFAFISSHSDQWTPT